MKSNISYDSKNMALFYFSGTGNTKIVANKISADLGILINNIEDDFDFSNLLDNMNTIIIMYPVYYSTPPIIVRDFINKYKRNLENKNIMSIVSQMCFSGDGAFVLSQYLPSSSSVIYSRHINMPSNISNIPILPYFENLFANYKIKYALKKASKISREIRENKLTIQGKTKFSSKLGLSQRVGGLAKEKDKRFYVWIEDNCIGCGLCKEICPSNNFEIKNKKAVAKGQCIFCTRCENKCPNKSIRVFINRKVKHQYRAPEKFLIN